MDGKTTKTHWFWKMAAASFVILMGIAVFIEATKTPEEQAAERVAREIEHGCAEFRRDESRATADGQSRMNLICREYGR